MSISFKNWADINTTRKKVEGYLSKNKNRFNEIFLCVIGFLYIFFIYEIFVKALNIVFISPDGYYMYDISRSIFVDKLEDFGKVFTIRNYQQDLEIFRNSAFPLFYPFLVACFNKIINLGIYSGIFINILISLFTQFLNFKISKKITGNYYAGFLINILLFLQPLYIDEILAARSIPLALLLYQTIVCIFLFNEKIDFKLSAILGIIAGLCTNTRFDSIIPMLAIPFVISLKNKKISWREGLLYLGTLLIMNLPWIIYSKIFFNQFFVSDNARATISIDLDFIFFYFSEPIKTIYDSPLEWIKVLFLEKIPRISYIFILNGYLLLIILLFFIFSKNDFRKKLKEDYLYSYLAISFLFCALLGGLMLSGFYWEVRYFIPIYWFISLLLLFYTDDKENLFKINLITSVLILHYLLSIIYDYGYRLNIKNFYEKEENKVDIYKIDRNLIARGENVLFVYYREHVIESMIFGIQNGINTIFFPYNIYPNDFDKKIDDFFKNYRIDYVYFNPLVISNIDLNNKKYGFIDRDTKFFNFDPIRKGYIFEKNNIYMIDTIQRYFKLESTKDKNLFKAKYISLQN